MQFSYSTVGDDHFDLKKGDVVLVFDKPEHEWWRGMIGEREGWFPPAIFEGCMFM